MAIRSKVITMSPLILNQEGDLEIDLDLWEVVKHSDGEYSDDSFSVDSLSDDDVISLDDASFVSLSPSVISTPPAPILPDTVGGELPADLHVDCDGDEVDDKDHGWTQRRIVLLRSGSPYSLGITFGDYFNRDGCYNDDGEEDRGVDDSEYDDSYDLDEELVPWSVSKKVGRQRMRKLGKRAISKVLTSKTSPYSHLKPGCVRGKHGLDLKFKC